MTKYHEQVTLTTSQVHTIDEANQPFLNQCRRHEIDVTGSIDIATRKKGKVTLTPHGTLTDEAKAIELAYLDQIEITANNNCTITVTGVE